MRNYFELPQAVDKINLIETACQFLLQGGSMSIPHHPARSMSIVAPEKLPPKKGLSFKQGQARLLHDLASIEMQAMELAVRTLAEYPDAPEEFKEELAEVAINEAEHLRICIEAIQELGFEYGSWDVHCALWEAVNADDEFLDRVLIVHRYLEGSGLDAGAMLLRRLNGLSAKSTERVVQQIVREEIAHVQFGSDWYRKLCLQQGLDPETDFFKRLLRLRHRIPKRIENIAPELRLQAGFTVKEVDFLQRYRDSFLLKPQPENFDYLVESVKIN